MLSDSSSQIPQQAIDSQLHKLRSMAVPQKYHQIVHRIFDKKLRSFLSLQTKQEVLQHCQQLLITKTIDYMNITNDLQNNQLKNLNLINITIMDKDKIIQNLKKQNQELKETIRENIEAISKLTRSQKSLKQELQDKSNKFNYEVLKYEQVIQQKEKNRTLIKSELEKKNKELDYELGIKVTELKKVLADSKEEIGLLRSSKEKDGLDLNRKIKDLQLDHQEARLELVKDKKYLQDLLEVREDDVKKRFVQKYKQQFQFELTVKFEKEKQKEKQKSKQKQKSKKADQLTIRSRSKSTRSKPGKTVTFQNQPFVFDRKLNEKFPMFKSQQTQFPQFPFLQFKHIPKKNNLSVESQTVFEEPQSENLTQFERRFKQFIQQKYKLEYKQRLQNKILQLKQKLKQEYLDCLKDAKIKMFSLKLSTVQLIQAESNKLRQIQQVYQSRPSKQQDLYLINQLLQEIETLKNKCFKANTNADNAYIALQQYHNKLQNYKQSVPITVVGNNPPKINKKKSLRLQLQLDRKSSIRNIKMSSTCSNYIDKNSKNHLMSMDSHYMTREVMLTECDSDMMSPLIKKSHKSRPNTGGVIKFRRKSIL